MDKPLLIAVSAPVQYKDVLPPSAGNIFLCLIAVKTAIMQNLENPQYLPEPLDRLSRNFFPDVAFVIPNPIADLLVVVAMLNPTNLLLLGETNKTSWANLLP